MAKTHGPLMSLNASGTIAGCATYRQTAGKNIAQAQTMRRAKPTESQSENRAAWAACAAHWRTIDTAPRAQWATLAARLSLPPFAFYAQEWHRQQSTALNPPLLPA